MYHFFVRQEQIQDGEIRVTGADVNHMKNVLRLRAGEKVLIGDGAGRDYLCQITGMSQEEVTAAVLSVDEEGTELPARLFLFQGLPKSDKLEWIIQKAVELGVCEIIPVAAKRTVVKLDGKKEEARLKRWNAIAESAAKQSKRSVIPRVTGVASFGEAVCRARELDLCMIPYELAQDMEKTRAVFAKALPGMDIGIFIGPEGGFEEAEIEEAERAGIHPVTLGRRILRTETAGLAVLAALMFQLEQR